MDAVFREDYLNCFTQVSRSWRVPGALLSALLSALIGDFGLTRGLGSTMPVSLSDDDYVSLAASFFASETGESGEDSSLVHVPDLLGTSETAPGCQSPTPGKE